MAASVHPLGSSKREPSLDAMMSLVAADMNGVNAVILERMQSKVALIPELAGHLIAGGGKRMRPMLTLACANLAASVRAVASPITKADDALRRNAS